MKRLNGGWLNGFIGVAIFSGSLPATRVAVLDFSPIFLTSARAVIAGILGMSMLLLLKQTKPRLNELTSLGITALGVVVGFPLLTGLALQHVSSAHSIVFTGLLPLCTAIFAVIRGGERPRPGFWVFSIMGSAFVVGYALFGGIEVSTEGDLYMLAAIIACGLGYAEGARLSRHLGGWQVISWALVLSLPVMTLIAYITMPNTFANVSSASWIGLGYVSLFSMLLGFVFWYRGLAQGGIAAVGQLQLIQPFMGFGLAALLLDEQVSMSMLLITICSLVCVVGAKRYA